MENVMVTIKKKEAAKPKHRAHGWETQEKAMPPLRIAHTPVVDVVAGKVEEGEHGVAPEPLAEPHRPGPFLRGGGPL